MTMWRLDTFFVCAAMTIGLGSSRAYGESSKQLDKWHAELSKASPKELMQFMGKGKMQSEKKPDKERSGGDDSTFSVVERKVDELPMSEGGIAPSSIWKMKPEEAALQLLEDNRSTPHCEKYNIKLTLKRDFKLPEVGGLYLSARTPACYNYVVTHYYLSCSEKNAELVYARSWSPGFVIRDAAKARTAYDFRRISLEPADARHLLGIAWWFWNVKTEKINEPNSTGLSSLAWSSADGDVSAKLLDSNGKQLYFEDLATRWFDSIPSRWSGDYDKDVRANILVDVLVNLAIIKNKGLWGLSAPPKGRSTCAVANGADYELLHLHQLQSTVCSILDDSDLASKTVPAEITEMAIHAAGDLCAVKARNKLKKLFDALPEPSLRETANSKLSEEWSRLHEVPDKERGENWEAKYKDVQDRYFENRKAMPEMEKNITAWRLALQSTLKKLKVTEDLDDLERLASSKEPEFKWALDALRQLDKKRYARALVPWIERSDGEVAREIFDQLEKVDPSIAETVALNVPSGKAHALSASALNFLSERNVPCEREKRVQTVLSILRGHDTNWKERLHAIRVLVPAENPFRFDSSEIDDTLIECLKPVRTESINFTPARAAKALAVRNGPRYFDKVLEHLKPGLDNEFDEMLAALAYMAGKGGDTEKLVLAKVVGAHLRESENDPRETLFAAWAANLRSLKGQIESLASDSPEDPESRMVGTRSNMKRRITGPFHVARKITAIWNCQDAVLRTKLLIAWSLEQPERMLSIELSPHGSLRMNLELSKCASELDNGQQVAIRDFISAIRKDQLKSPDTNEDQKAELLQQIEKLLNINNAK